MSISLQNWCQVCSEEGGREQLPFVGCLGLLGDLGCFVRNFHRHFWTENLKKETLNASQLPKLLL